MSNAIREVQFKFDDVEGEGPITVDAGDQCSYQQSQRHGGRGPHYHVEVMREWAEKREAAGIAFVLTVEQAAELRDDLSRFIKKAGGRR